MSSPNRLTKIRDYPALLTSAWREHLESRHVKMPTVVSLFAGCGGSSLGYSMAGFRELLAVEWNREAIETFRQNFPGVSVYDQDICGLTVDAILQCTGLQTGRLDVLDGSPPCQGFTTIGKRRFSDSRNQLFREYIRLLQGLQPKAFILENVSGLVKGSMKLIFADMLRALKDSGYYVSTRLMNALYFGVPQSRIRIIVIGIRQDLHQSPTHPIAMTMPILLGEALRTLSDRKQHAPTISTLKEIRWNDTRRGSGHRERFALKRLHWTKPVNAVVGISGSGGHMHPDEPRNLDIGELQRLASFPDPFTFCGDWYTALQGIGNSVPPLFMRAIALHVKSLLMQAKDVAA